MNSRDEFNVKLMALLELGFAVAFSKSTKREIHLRAVRDGDVVEADGSTPLLAVEHAFISMAQANKLVKK